MILDQGKIIESSVDFVIFLFFQRSIGFIISESKDDA